MRTAIIIILVLLAGVCYAEQQYNAFTGRWETTNPGDTMRYNTFDNSWSYQSPSSELEYNAFENTWEYAEPSTNYDNQTYDVNPWD